MSQTITADKPRRIKPTTLAAIGFAAPLIIYMLIFYVWPLIQNISMSMHRYTRRTFVTGDAPWSGFDIYKEILSNQQFWTILGQTLIFVFASIVFQYSIGLALAVFFNQNFKLSAALRGAFLVPWLLPPMISGTIWQWMMDADSGVINNFIKITDKSIPELQGKPISSLISNTMTLRMLTEQNREQAIYKIVNHPIPQYGRGLFTKPLATKTTQDFIDGANAAEALDGNQVAHSLQTMHHVMSNDGRNQIDSFYQALWCGHGGAIANYPSPALLGNELNDEGWDYLLSHSDENTQWSSIPAKLTLPQTSQLNAQKHPYNFNSLIAGKANTVAVKAAKVVRTPPSLFFESAHLPFWHWTIDENHLIATNGTTQIIFSDSTEDIKKMYESEDIAMHEGLNVDTFIHRVAGLKIQRVQVDNRDSVTVYNIPDSKIQKSNTLRMFGKNARVISCEAQIPISKREKNIKFDYTNGIANVQRGICDLQAFAQTIIPAMVDLKESEYDSLSHLFMEETQGALF